MNLLYIGNALAVHGATPTSADIMPELLQEEGYAVDVASSRRNVVPRMADMLWSIFCHTRSVDVVLIDTYSTLNFWYAFFCSMLCRILNLKYIPILRGGSLPERINRSPRMTKVVLGHAAAIVTPSRYLQVASKVFGYDAVVIPNTIPISEYEFKERKELRPRLLYVRSFAALYNPQMALHVLKSLTVAYSNAHLCMVGPDKDGTLEECRRLARKLKIEGMVEFPGKLEKSEWHRLAGGYDIFINTTNKDNTPVSVIEAMALGLPVVSTNPGGLPYLIKDGEDGLLVEPNDVEAMVAAVKRIVGDPRLAAKLSREAYKKAEGFGWSVVRCQWNALLNELRRG